MSAANLSLSVTAGRPPTIDLGALSMAEQMRHVREYCEENPLKYYEAAVIDLYDSMRRAQGLRSWIATLTGHSITGANITAPQPPKENAEDPQQE